jgi:hypothetical protein
MSFPSFKSEGKNIIFVDIQQSGRKFVPNDDGQTKERLHYQDFPVKPFI